MKEETRKIAGDVFVYIASITKEWDMSSREKKAYREVGSMIISNTTTDEKMCCAVADMLDTFAMQASDADIIISFYEYAKEFNFDSFN